MDQVEYLGYTGSVLGYNLYTYCEGNPIMYVDYSGSTPIMWLFITVLSICIGLFVFSQVQDDLRELFAKNKKVKEPPINNNNDEDETNPHKYEEEGKVPGSVSIHNPSQDLHENSDFSIGTFKESGISPSAGGYGSYYGGGTFSGYDSVNIMNYLLDKFGML